MTSRPNEKTRSVSRRTILKSMGLAPLLLRSAPIFPSSLLFASPAALPGQNPVFPFSDVRLMPHYPAKSPLADVLRLVPPGSDEYATERYAFEIEAILNQWGQALKTSAQDLSRFAKFIDDAVQGSMLIPANESAVRSGFGFEVTKRRFAPDIVPGRQHLLESIQSWLGPLSRKTRV